MKKNLKKVYFRPDFYFETTKDFCLHLGFSPEDVAEIADCSIQTARRYIKTGQHPRWLLPLLYACAGRVLAPGFDGWVFKNKSLACPGWRYTLTAPQIQAYTWHLEQITASSRTIARLNSEIDQLKDKKKQHTAAVFQFSDFKKN